MNNLLFGFSNPHKMEVEVANIIKRADLVWRDNNYSKTRHIVSRNKEEPLTEEEKTFLVRYFTLIKFPLKIIFWDGEEFMGTKKSLKRHRKILSAIYWVPKTH